MAGPNDLTNPNSENFKLFNYLVKVFSAIFVNEQEKLSFFTWLKSLFTSQKIALHEKDAYRFINPTPVSRKASIQQTSTQTDTNEQLESEPDIHPTSDTAKAIEAIKKTVEEAIEKVKILEKNFKESVSDKRLKSLNVGEQSIELQDIKNIKTFSEDQHERLNLVANTTNDKAELVVKLAENKIKELGEKGQTQQIQKAQEETKQFIIGLEVESTLSYAIGYLEVEIKKYEQAIEQAITDKAITDKHEVEELLTKASQDKDKLKGHLTEKQKETEQRINNLINNLVGKCSLDSSDSNDILARTLMGMFNLNTHTRSPNTVQAPTALPKEIQEEIKEAARKFGAAKS
jgi:hypothetical protein